MPLSNSEKQRRYRQNKAVLDYLNDCLLYHLSFHPTLSAHGERYVLFLKGDS